MPIKIDKVSVQNLGPIQDFNEDFGLLNLIYSKNEKGKSFLTEFIISSLFKNEEYWGLRDSVKNARGKVKLSGLKINEFSPASKKKLDNFIGQEKGLPQSLKKLLVVKSGEVEIDEGGISRALLTEVLSGKRILEEVDGNIKEKSIKNAKIENNAIDINKQGIGKRYYEKKHQLEAIEGLWDRIITNYDKGGIKALESGNNILEQKLSKIDKAKRYLAYTLSQEISRLREALEPLQKDIIRIEEGLKKYMKEKKGFKEEEKAYRALKDRDELCQWLTRAKELYNSIKSKIVIPPHKITLISGITFEILAIITGIFGKKIPTISAIGLGVVLTGIYFWKFHKSIKSIGDIKELDLLNQEFKQKIGKKLQSEIDIDVELNGCKETSRRLIEMESRIKKINQEMQETGAEIMSILQQQTGKVQDESEWGRTIQMLEEKRESIRESINEKDKLRGKLGVREADFLTVEPEIEYNEEEEENINREYDDVSNDLKNKENEIKKLKISVQQALGSDAEDWNELTERLMKKKEEVEKELAEIEAGIIGKNIVHRVIEEFQGDEDTKIQEGLSSNNIVGLLKGLTNGHYNKIEWDKDGLNIGNDYESYNLDVLSSGTIEQVMMALRIGFASKLLSGENMFLILDDAFIHTDWERREGIIKNQIPILLRDGWQIIYLTMDDHTKGLFDEMGKKEFPNEYKSIQL